MTISPCTTASGLKSARYKFAVVSTTGIYRRRAVLSRRYRQVPCTAGWVFVASLAGGKTGRGVAMGLNQPRSLPVPAQAAGFGSGHDVVVARPQDPRLSFDAAAEIYDRVRPSYPAALFDALFDLLRTEPEIVEVGPGTGQATVDLLARGASVRAIEIGPAMAAILRSNLSSDRLDISVGDFEELELPPRSADAVFSATAYHWISARGRTDQPARILRPGGTLAIVDLIQVDSPDDRGFFRATQPIYEKYGQGHTGPPAPPRDNVDPPIRALLVADERFDQIAVRRYDWNQVYSGSTYRDLMLSYSGTQMMDERARVGLLNAIESLVTTDFDGHVTRPLVVTLTTAILA
jgi:SAM-dependent methyltransferase